MSSGGSAPDLAGWRVFRGAPHADRPGLITRVVTWPLEALVVLYRTLVSPLLPPSCRYYPSCSTYALTALRRFGPLVGTALAVRRLAHCHPWSDGGVDHVPPLGAHGLPDWAAHRADAARREAAWAEPHTHASTGPGPEPRIETRTEPAPDRGPHGVRNDDWRPPELDLTLQRRGMR